MGKRHKRIDPPHPLKLRPTLPTLARLVRRLSESTEHKYQGSPCWEFPGAQDDLGYGRVKIDGKPLWLHRAMYAIFRGSIPEGREVDHRCKYPNCCNPWHLRCRTIGRNRGDVRRLPRSIPARTADVADDIPF